MDFYINTKLNDDDATFHRVASRVIVDIDKKTMICYISSFKNSADTIPICTKCFVISNVNFEMNINKIISTFVEVNLDNILNPQKK